MSNAVIQREALVVVGRAQELIRLPKPVPGIAGEWHVAALGHIVIARDDEQRCRVRRSVGVGKIFEPGNETCALCDLVWNFAVVALILFEELDRGASGGIVPGGIE